MALPHLLVAGLLAATSTGCVFLDAMLGTGAFDPDASFAIPTFPLTSPAPAAYDSGRVTITIAGAPGAAGETVVLDELVSATVDELGTHVVWENDVGWYVTFIGYSEFASQGYLSIDRVDDHEHLVLVDQTRCLTTTTQHDAAALVGTATCRGLSWADYFGSYSSLGGFPQPVPSQTPFDAEITFEAR